MLDQERTQLMDFERKNATVFQVMGSLKLLNIKVKSFVRRLESVGESDTKKILELNHSFRILIQDVSFFQEEFKCFSALDVHVPSVDTFAKNANRIFATSKQEYSILEMRRISVYLYRIADIMLSELALWKRENEAQMHEIQKKNGKYYFNR